MQICRARRALLFSWKTCCCCLKNKKLKFSQNLTGRIDYNLSQQIPPHLLSMLRDSWKTNFLVLKYASQHVRCSVLKESSGKIFHIKWIRRGIILWHHQYLIPIYYHLTAKEKDNMWSCRGDSVYGNRGAVPWGIVTPCLLVLRDLNYCCNKPFSPSIHV